MQHITSGKGIWNHHRMQFFNSSHLFSSSTSVTLLKFILTYTLHMTVFTYFFCWLLLLSFLAWFARFQICYCWVLFLVWTMAITLGRWHLVGFALGSQSTCFFFITQSKLQLLPWILCVRATHKIYDLSAVFIGCRQCNAIQWNLIWFKVSDIPIYHIISSKQNEIIPVWLIFYNYFNISGGIFFKFIILCGCWNIVLLKLRETSHLKVWGMVAGSAVSMSQWLW